VWCVVGVGGGWGGGGGERGGGGGGGEVDTDQIKNTEKFLCCKDVLLV